MGGERDGNSINFAQQLLSFSRRAQRDQLFTPKHQKHQNSPKLTIILAFSLNFQYFRCSGMKSSIPCARRGNDSNYHAEFVVFPSRSPQKCISLPKTRISTILGDFTENHLKWVEFSEKYRSERENNLK